MRSLFVPGVFFLTAALVLLILVSISEPYIHSIYYLKAVLGTNGFSSSSNVQVRWGIWSICSQASGSDAWSCTPKQLGYGLTSGSRIFPGEGQVGAVISEALAKSLVINPIAAAFTFVAWLFALSNSVVLDLIAALLSFLAALVTALALALDLGCFVTLRHKINDDVTDATATLGPAIWMVLAALVALLLASVTVCFGHTRSKKRGDYYSGYSYRPWGRRPKY